MLDLVRKSKGQVQRIYFWIAIGLLGATVWAAHLIAIRIFIEAETQNFDFIRVSSMSVLAVSGTAMIASLGLATLAISFACTFFAVTTGDRGAKARKAALEEASQVDSLTKLPGRSNLEERFAALSGMLDVKEINPLVLLF